MNTDINGCAAVAKGQEQYEWFTDSFRHIRRIQYDYRTESGKLFSTVANTLELARQKRDNWLKTQ